ncbi:MAG: hypothetical protein Q8L41_15925 [Anaerolineales bacterium]|nr:hypothetical protein [Anaerolineales bacterium]
MARGSRRYPLVNYTHMIDRWWPAIFALGFALLGVAWAIYNRGFEQWRWLGMAGIGGLNIFIGFLLLIVRKSAYVQAFNDHLRLATPFLRLNISYKRMRRTTSTNMGALFPPNSLSTWRAGIIQPIAKKTVIVIELNAFPMPQSSLRLFLSPLFFKDKTPNFVILVNDWMRFSSELESMRTGLTASSTQKNQDHSILSRLPDNK